MNLAHYLTAKPFPIPRGRIHVLEGPGETPAALEEYRQEQIEHYNQRVLNAMVDSDMSVSEIIKESNLKDSSVRRTLERLLETGRVSMTVSKFGKTLWSRKC